MGSTGGRQWRERGDGSRCEEERRVSAVDRVDRNSVVLLDTSEI